MKQVFAGCMCVPDSFYGRLPRRLPGTCPGDGLGSGGLRRKEPPCPAQRRPCKGRGRRCRAGLLGVQSLCLPGSILTIFLFYFDKNAPDKMSQVDRSESISRTQSLATTCRRPSARPHATLRRKGEESSGRRRPRAPRGPGEHRPLGLRGFAAPHGFIY